MVGADVVVDAVADEAGRLLLESHRRTSPSVPVCVMLPPGEGEIDPAVPQIPRDASDAVVIGILERLVKNGPLPQAPEHGTS